MAEDPKERFGNLAEIYARHRPNYPAAALDFIAARAGLVAGSDVVDVGSGTGILSRQLAARAYRVVGVEPNEEMRRRAESEAARGDVPPVRYVAGSAEATGLPDGSADAVIAGQAFHWFRAGEALAEFRRVLRHGGWAALLWNERDPSDSFTRDYGLVIRSAVGAAEIEGRRARAGQALLDSALFEARERATFSHRQTVDEEGLIGRALSASYAPREGTEGQRFIAALRALFAAHQKGGRVTIGYETSVFLGRCPAL